MAARVDLAVVGGGISGLAAGWEAHRRGATVVVLEAGERVGGKLRTSPLGGVDVDESADAFLARVPEAVDLCAELGITADLVAPGTGTAYLWRAGGLQRLPAEQLLGIPTDLDALAATGLLSAEGVERARRDLTSPDDRPPAGTDESVGDLVGRRLGTEVLDRLVAPLVGSIYAGDCDRMSLQVSAAQIAAARDRDPDDPSLVRAAAALRSQATDTGKPVFLAPRGGVGRLADRLREALGDAVHPVSPVAGLAPDGAGWRIAVEQPAGGGHEVSAGAVVVATPAYVSAPLLAPVAPEAAAILGAIEHASVALLGLAVPRDGIDHPLDGSGFLVARDAGLLLTACSWTTSKWPHLDVDPDLALLRASAGHDGDDRALGLEDGDLVAALVADLRASMGVRADPVDVRLTRWPSSFPQPRPGHLDRVAAAERALAAVSPRLAATGAWARGVGIPACIRGARAAAAAALGGTTAP
jgi:protoporphyrinogen/coproporphyrinogen III oxidase